MNKLFPIVLALLMWKCSSASSFSSIQSAKLVDEGKLECSYSVHLFEGDKIKISYGLNDIANVSIGFQRTGFDSIFIEDNIFFDIFLPFSLSRF